MQKFCTNIININFVHRSCINYIKISSLRISYAYFLYINLIVLFYKSVDGKPQKDNSGDNYSHCADGEVEEPA